MRSRQVRVAQAGVLALSGGLVAAGVWLLDSDAARASVVALAAGFVVMALLLPLLTGRLKVGVFEGELRDDIEEAVVESGATAGLGPEVLEGIARGAADEVVRRIPTASPPGARRGQSDIMVCASCGVMARYEPPARARRGFADSGIAQGSGREALHARVPNGAARSPKRRRPSHGRRRGPLPLGPAQPLWCGGSARPT